MELFEKIDKLLEINNISRTKLAEKLSIKQNTLNGYFNVEQQSKLTPYLWKILEIFPETSRNWLFFDEGEMLDNAEESQEVSQLKNKIVELEEELKEEQRLNRKLTNKILDSDIEKTA